MSLAGKGAVAIWHDIAPEGRNEFYAWHGHEHYAGARRHPRIPARPPVRRRPGDARILQPLRDGLALHGDRCRLPRPPQCADAVDCRDNQASSATSRARCAKSRRASATGRAAWSRRCATTSSRRVPPIAMRPAQETLAEISEAPAGVAGCHLLIADEAASARRDRERSACAPRSNPIPRWIMLIESWDDVEPFGALCAEVLTDAAFEDAVAPPALGIYRLQNSRGPLPWSAGLSRWRQTRLTDDPGFDRRTPTTPENAHA